MNVKKKDSANLDLSMRIICLSNSYKSYGENVSVDPLDVEGTYERNGDSFS